MQLSLANAALLASNQLRLEKQQLLAAMREEFFGIGLGQYKLWIWVALLVLWSKLFFSRYFMLFHVISMYCNGKQSRSWELAKTLTQAGASEMQHFPHQRQVLPDFFCKVSKAVRCHIGIYFVFASLQINKGSVNSFEPVEEIRDWYSDPLCRRTERLASFEGTLASLLAVHPVCRLCGGLLSRWERQMLRAAAIFSLSIFHSEVSKQKFRHGALFPCNWARAVMTSHGQ